MKEKNVEVEEKQYMHFQFHFQYFFMRTIFYSVEIMQILNIIVILSIRVYCSVGVTAKNNDNDMFILNLTMKDYESSEVSRHVLFVNK